MSRKKTGLLILIALPIMLGSSFGQNIYRSDGIRLFNKENYTSAVDSFESFATRHPAQEAAARYFIGECLYNLGLLESNRGAAMKYFEGAFENFESSIDLAQAGAAENLDHIHSARYKCGWSSFRLGELSGDVTHFLSAYSHFESIGGEAPDSLRAKSRYMAGESKFRIGSLKKYEISRTGFSLPGFDEVIDALSRAQALFEETAADPAAPPRIAACAGIRNSDCSYQRGTAYMVLPERIFRRAKDSTGGGDAVRTAAIHLERSDYGGILSSLRGNSRADAAPVVHYSQAMKHFAMYLLSRPDTTGIKGFHDNISSLRTFTEFEDEIDFRLGNIDQTLPPGSPEFISLASNSTSRYAGVSGSIAEAYYWLGFAQLIKHNYADSRENLRRYLNAAGRLRGNPRIAALIEDAKTRRYRLDFELSLGNKSYMEELRDSLESFYPLNDKNTEEKECLYRLVRIELGESIGEVLEGSREERLDECMAIVRYLLKRGAAAIGKRREHYLSALDVILEEIRADRPEATDFFMGIAKSLEAEIQDTPAAKERMFREATGILGRASRAYEREARYITGRCLFFAKEYDRAQRVFEEMIDRDKSLRSLFFLGEIFRAQQDWQASKRCHMTVMAKTEASPEGEFWYNNSKAAISDTLYDRYEISERDIDTEMVVFPESLLVMDGDLVSYENLADMEFLKHQDALECIEMLKGYVLPKRSIYPSSNRLSNSIFPRGESFEEYTAGIDEKMGGIKSGLRLKVLPLEIAGQECSVFLGGQRLPEPEGGFYVRKPIDLFDTLEISVAHPRCYSFLEEHEFIRPGEELVLAYLSKRVEFDEGELFKDKEVPFRFYPLRENLDRNRIVLEAGQSITEDTDLYKDISSNISLRDAAYHRENGEFLVVDCRESSALRSYSRYGRTSRDKLFVLKFEDPEDSLNSPEGLAIDSKGNIYVADWGNHRVVVFDREGSELYQFGDLAVKKSGDSNEVSRLVFPTRVAVEEDTSEYTFEGKPARRQMHILVADRYGIHKFGPGGRYLDTPVGTDESGFESGSFYSFKILGYGEDSRIFLTDRDRGRTYIFSPE